MKAVVFLFFFAQLALTALATPMLMPNLQDLLHTVYLIFLPTQYEEPD